jgi:hypothetical protein
MDLRRPKRDWRKRPPSLWGVLALSSLLFILGGTAALPQNGEGNDTLSNALCGVGLAIASIPVLAYILGMRDKDPRKKRFDVD